MYLSLYTLHLILFILIRSNFLRYQKIPFAFIIIYWYWEGTFTQRQNGRPFADDIFKCIFLNENVYISIKTSLKFVPRGPNDNIPGLVQIMAWRRPGNKPLSEPRMFSLLRYICVTQPQRVKVSIPWLLMIWWCKQPDHQHPWHWLS